MGHGPARSRARPWGRRSVHRLAEVASRSRFGAFVYTVATREGYASGRGDAGVYTNRQKWPLGAVLEHSCTLLRLARAARVAPPLGWRLCRDSNPHKPRGARYGDWASTGDPSAQGSVAFGSSGASGASRDALGSLSGPCRTTSTTFSRRTYQTHMRARRTVVETLLSTLNLMNSQNPRWRSVQSLRAMLAPLPCEAPLANSV